MTLDEQIADTIPPPPPTLRAPPDKACGCGRTHDAFEWLRLPLVGEMRDGVEAVELRNCQCKSTIAVPLCLVRGCGRRASWVGDNLEDYCEAHATEWLMAEAAE